MVADIQKALNQIEGNPVVAESGVFDRQTEAALKAFQKNAGLEATGVIAQPTIDALNKAVAGVTEYGKTDMGVTEYGVTDLKRDSVSADEKEIRKRDASFQGDVMEASLRSRLPQDETAGPAASKPSPEGQAYRYAGQREQIQSKLGPGENVPAFEKGYIFAAQDGGKSPGKLDTAGKNLTEEEGIHVQDQKTAVKLDPGEKNLVEHVHIWAARDQKTAIDPFSEIKPLEVAGEGQNKLTPDQVQINDKGEVIVKKP